MLSIALATVVKVDLMKRIDDERLREKVRKQYIDAMALALAATMK